MADPLSIAGLALTAIDQLWKIGERTAELTANFQHFDQDLCSSEVKLRHDNARTKALTRVLFENSPAYEGQALFEQLDTDVQTNIISLFEQAINIIEQAFKTLDRLRPASPRKLPSYHSYPLADDGNIQRSGSPTLGHDLAQQIQQMSSTTLQRVRWSLMDKKRTEALIRDFRECNDRIHDTIKLACFATSIGVNLQHLMRLETDVDSQALGYNVDARLRMTASEENSIAGTAEVLLNDMGFRFDEIADVEVNFGVLKDQRFLVEYRSYAPESPIPVEMDSRTHVLIDDLAKILQQKKEVGFRTLTCMGWVRQMQHNRIVMLFELPEGAEPQPVSLHQLLGTQSPPPLDVRFELALQLARCISHLQLVKWVHKSFRSENILFFPPAGTSAPVPAAAVDVGQPWVLGYEHSRPETFFSDGHSDAAPARDVYRHPERQGRPTQPSNKYHDIYALGVVLLEIGLWQQAVTLDKSGFADVRDPFAVKKQLLRHAKKRLASKMGEKYRQIVIKCLEGDFEAQNDSQEGLKLQQNFRFHVVRVIHDAAQCL